LFKNNLTPGYEDTWRGIKLGFDELKMGFGANKSKEFLTYYLSMGWVGKRANGNRSAYFMSPTMKKENEVSVSENDGQFDDDPF
jgi:hypothetical protein